MNHNLSRQRANDIPEATAQVVENVTTSKTTHMQAIRDRSAGFTLVEILIATLIFSVGMLVLLSMEFASLKSYKVSRDQTVATDVARRSIQLTQTEAAQWTTGGVPAATEIYDSDLGIVSGGILAKIATSNWGWEVLTPSPVNAQFTVDGQNQRFCVYGRGDYLEAASTDPGYRSLIQAHYVVVFPGANNDYPPGFQCTNLGSICDPDLSALLQPDVASQIELELCGYRAIFMGANFSRRR